MLFALLATAVSILCLSQATQSKIGQVISVNLLNKKVLGSSFIRINDEHPH